MPVETVTVPRRLRLDIYVLSSLIGWSVSLLGLLSLLLGYSSAKWFLAITIAWPTVHSYVSALAAGYVPESPASVPAGEQPPVMQMQASTPSGATVTATVTSGDEATVTPSDTSPATDDAVATATDASEAQAATPTDADLAIQQAHAAVNDGPTYAEDGSPATDAAGVDVPPAPASTATTPGE